MLKKITMKKRAYSNYYSTFYPIHVFSFMINSNSSFIMSFKKLIDNNEKNYSPKYMMHNNQS